MAELPRHEVHEKSGIEEFDVFIAGSGPIGATFARLLVDQGLNVVMAEIGDQQSLYPAAHLKNEIKYQKDFDAFVKVILGALSPASIPKSSTVIPTLDPAAWRPENPDQAFILNGRNPHQQEHNNLGAEGITRCLGGMSTHWTCAVPRFHRDIERPKIFPDDPVKDDNEWDLLYTAAERLIGMSEHEFDKSIRHNAVLRALNEAKQSLPFTNPETVIFKSLPLACHRLEDDSPYVQWHSAENVYGDMFAAPKKKNRTGVQRGSFHLLINTRCTKLHPKTLPMGTENVELGIAEVQDLLNARYKTHGSKPVQINFAISAKTFVVAAGAVGTAQILASSGFGGLRDQKKPLVPNLGVRITEQPLAFCQVVLRQTIVNDIGNTESDKNPQWWKHAVKAHREKHLNDPIPIPFQDGEPQITIPVSEGRPWHVQIHRDAFSYGEVGPRVDPRLVVDLRYFGMQSGVKENRLLFENDIKDMYGLPQPTFEYKVLSSPEEDHVLDATRMMNEMTNVANALGGYLPDSNPQFMTPGLGVHLGGTVRLGNDNGAESVADYTSRVWQFKNLYVGGNGVIPTPFGSNPTLTSMCFAIRSAYFIYNYIKNSEGIPDPSSSTPPEWVNWSTDPTDPNHPDHKNLRTPQRYVGIPQTF